MRQAKIVLSDAFTAQGHLLRKFYRQAFWRSIFQRRRYLRNDRPWMGQEQPKPNIVPAQVDQGQKSVVRTFWQEGQ